MGGVLRPGKWTRTQKRPDGRPIKTSPSGRAFHVFNLQGSERIVNGRLRGPSPARARQRNGIDVMTEAGKRPRKWHYRLIVSDFVKTKKPSRAKGGSMNPGLAFPHTEHF